jgi:hypothetical protein
MIGEVKTIHLSLQDPNVHRFLDTYTGIVIWSDGDVVLYNNGFFANEPSLVSYPDGGEHYFLLGRPCTFEQYQDARAKEFVGNVANQREMLDKLVAEVMNG